MSFDRVNLGRRIAQNLSANMYNQGVTVAVQLVGVPILIHAWGVNLYGAWLILFAIPAYLSMTDLGFSQSAGNDMSARVARSDRLGALTVFQSLGALVWSVAVLGLILTAALVWRLPMQDWLHFETMSAEAVRWVLWLLAAEVLVRLPDGVTHAGFRASGETAFHVGLASTARLLQFASIWIVALGGGGPVAAAAAFLGVRALATPAFSVLLVHRHRWLCFGLKHAHWAEFRRLLRPALANLALPFAQALNIQGMVLVVGATLGPLAVVVFSTLRTLTRLALQLVQVVSEAAEPEIAAAYGMDNQPLMQSLFTHTMRAGLWVALGAAGVLAAFGGLILETWTHGSVTMNPALFAWLLSSAVASVLWSGPLIVLKAANRHLGAALVFVLGSAAAVAVAGLLLKWTGNLANAGLALLLMDAAMALYAIRAAARLLNVQPLASLARASNPYPLLHLLLGKAHVH